MSWQEVKVQELQQGYAILSKALQEQTLPELSSIPSNVLETSAYTAALGFLLLLLLVPSTRRLIWNTLDTCLAVVCLILLCGVVIGMPFGAIYLGSKGFGFLVTSLLHAFPQLGTMLASLQSSLGLGPAGGA